MLTDGDRHDVALVPGLRRAMETAGLAGSSELQKRMRRMLRATRRDGRRRFGGSRRLSPHRGAARFASERLQANHSLAWEDDLMWLAGAPAAHPAPPGVIALAWPVGFDAGMRGVVARDVADVTVDELQSLAAAVADDLAAAGYAWTIGTNAAGGLDSTWTCPNVAAVPGFGAPSGLRGGLLMEPGRAVEPGAREYLRLTTLLQMVWTDHPVNRERTRSGRAVIDGVHVWTPTSSVGGHPHREPAANPPSRAPCRIRLQAATERVTDLAPLTRATLAVCARWLDATPVDSIAAGGSIVDRRAAAPDSLIVGVDDRFLCARDETETLQALDAWLEHAPTAGLLWDSQARAGLMPRPIRWWMRFPAHGWIPA